MPLVSVLEEDCLLPEESLSIDRLIASFKSLIDQDDSKDKLLIEQQKLRIIQLIENHIKKEMLLHYVPIIPSNKVTSTTFNHVIKRLFYNFLLVFGLFQDASATYLFGNALLALIPGITNPVLIPLSILFMALECILFYAFEVSLLKTALGIPQDETDLSLTLDTYSSQLNTTTRIMSITSILAIDTEMYECIMAFIELLHNDLLTKHHLMLEHKEPIWKKALNYTVTSFGALSSIAGSYFMANAFLTLWAASLVATPIGIVIILLTIISGLGFYYAMGASSMARLVNPNYDKFLDLQKEFTRFKEEYNNDLCQIKSIKARFENFKKASTSDVDVTDESKHIRTANDCIDIGEPRVRHCPSHLISVQNGLSFFAPDGKHSESTLSNHSAEFICE